MEYTYNYKSPVGLLTLASDGESLTGLWFNEQKYYGSGHKLPEPGERLPVFEAAIRWLDLYFSGQKPDFLPPLAPQGTPFRRAVWDILLKIPYGETTTYGKIAEEIAAARGLEHMSAQAVGQAVGHNPIGILIPCHRVMGTDGSLTGYAGGLDRKEYLLRLECAI